LNEIRILASINHPNVIGYKEAFFNENTLCIIMEHANEGDLLKKIDYHSRRNLPISESEI
jgi:NIMA (never in mitosis gene a)-related kinase